MARRLVINRRVLRAGALAAIVAAAGACGASARTETSPTTSTAPGPAAAIELAGEAPSCPEPAAPTAVARAYPEQETLPSVAGEDRVVPAPMTGVGSTVPDTDGDGRPDEVVVRDVGTDPVALRRGDGVVTLTTSTPGEQVGSVVPVGDLDGDGQAELAAIVTDVETGGLRSLRTWIAAAPAPAGTIDVARAGGATVEGALGAVGSIDAGELLVTPGYQAAGGGGATWVVATADLGRALHGGGPVTPRLRLSGTFLAWVDGADGRELVTAEVAADGSGAILRFGGSDACRAFTTAPARWLPGYTQPVTVPKALVSTAGVDLVLAQSSRSGAVSYLWRVPGWQP